MAEAPLRPRRRPRAQWAGTQSRDYQKCAAIGTARSGAKSATRRTSSTPLLVSRSSSLSVLASYLIDRSGSRPVCYDVEPESDRKARPNHHDKQHAEAHGAQAPRARSGSRRWATIGGDRGRTKLERPANGLRRGQGGPVRSEPPFRLSDANLRLGAEPLIEMTTPPWVPTHNQDGHRPGPASR